MHTVREEVLAEHFASLLEGLVLSEANLKSLKIALKGSLADKAESRLANVERNSSESAMIRAKLERMYLNRIESKPSPEVELAATVRYRSL